MQQLLRADPLLKKSKKREIFQKTRRDNPVGKSNQKSEEV